MIKGYKGFTLIELMSVLAIIGIIAVIVIPAVFGSSSDTQMGWNGVTETRCQSGFKTIVGGNGFVQQLIDENGRGIPCD